MCNQPGHFARNCLIKAGDSDPIPSLLPSLTSSLGHFLTLFSRAWLKVPKLSLITLHRQIISVQYIALEMVLWICTSYQISWLENRQTHALPQKHLDLGLVYYDSSSVFFLRTTATNTYGSFVSQFFPEEWILLVACLLGFGWTSIYLGVVIGGSTDFLNTQQIMHFMHEFG